MVVRFARWGNSLALRVPSHVAREIGASEGVEADVVVEGGRLVVMPKASEPTFQLADLLAGITEENAHDEIATGAPVGREFW